MKNKVIYGIVLLVCFLSMLVIPFMPYLHMNILMEYLGKAELSAVELAKQMYLMHGSPDATSIFGYAHYEDVTLVLMIAAAVMIALPILLELVGMVLLLGGKTAGKRKAGCVLAFLTVLMFVGCIVGFTFAHKVVNASTSAAFGPYFGLAAGVLFWLAALGIKAEAERAGRVKRAKPDKTPKRRRAEERLERAEGVSRTEREARQARRAAAHAGRENR